MCVSARVCALDPLRYPYTCQQASTFFISFLSLSLFITLFMAQLFCRSSGLCLNSLMLLLSLCRCAVTHACTPTHTHTHTHFTGLHSECLHSWWLTRQTGCVGRRRAGASSYCVCVCVCVCDGFGVVRRDDREDKIKRTQCLVKGGALCTVRLRVLEEDCSHCE